MKQIIKIAKDVSLPSDLTTQSITILAKRRVGKSYTMRKIWEQLLKISQQVVVVDPKGDQWGIRSSADGKKPGFPVLIIGGEHGDLPLEREGGELIARLVVEQQVNVLLDTSQLSKSSRAVFMATFLENLYRLKAQEKYRTPLCVIIDEADEIAPQRPQKGEERMLGAIDDIVRRGGQRGLGSILVTQRSASLNKNVLTQSEMLILLRTIAPQDLAAVKAWIDVHGTLEQQKIIMEELPSLPRGDAYFWSPAWPGEDGMFQRAHILPIETFDSAKTPEVGEKRIIPKNLADVDLDMLKEQMAATIEKVKSDNPATLKRRIAELEKHKCPVVTQNPVKVERIEVPAVGKRALESLKKSEAEMRQTLSAMRKFGAMYSEKIDQYGVVMQKLIALIDKIEHPPYRAALSPAVMKQTFEHNLFPPKTSKKTSHTPNQNDLFRENEGITGPEQKVLSALAWCESIGNKNPPNELVAFLSGYSHFRSTGYTNPRGYLKAKGLIDYSNGAVFLTEAGREKAIIPEAPLTQEALHRAVLERLDGSEKKLLVPLLEKYPEGISNTDLCASAGYMHERSTGYTNPRGRLKSFGLVEYLPGGIVKAKSLLFLE